MSSIEEKADAERDDTMHHGEILTKTAIHQTCKQSFNNNNDDVDDAENEVVYEENRINLSLLDPSRFGWTALGGIADLLTPHERARRKSTKKVHISARNARKRSRKEAFSKEKMSTASQRKVTIKDVSSSRINQKRRNVPKLKSTNHVTEVADVKSASIVDICDDNATESSSIPLATSSTDTNGVIVPKSTEITTTTTTIVSSLPEIKKDESMISDNKYSPKNQSIDNLLGDSEISGTKKFDSLSHTNSSLRYKAMNDDETTLDILAYHRGREGFEVRDTVSNELLYDTDVVDTNHNVDGPKSTIANVVIQIPIQDNNCETEFRQMIKWDLSDPTIPNPMEFACNIGQQFGLSYPQICDVAISIQTQLREFVNDNCSFSSPLLIDIETPNQKASAMVPQLYGEVTGFLQQGGLCYQQVAKPKAPLNTTKVDSFVARRSLSTCSTRSVSTATKQASHRNKPQQSNGIKTKFKHEPPPARVSRQKAVPKLPISEFPREVSNGKDLDFGYDMEYKTLFLESGSFLVTNDNKKENKYNNLEETMSSPSIPEKQSVPMEDGSVDFCNVCKTVGNLLCCDFCPRAFHCDCIDSAAIPENMNDETKWECPSCIQERNGLPGDAIVETPMFDTIATAYNVDISNSTNAQHVTVLCMLYEMLQMLMNYDFGDIFRHPVNCSEIPTYKTIVKKPMDLGTISKNIETGKYELTSLEGVILAVLKDIELVWHNCFIFNVEGSAVYRMAIIHKQRSYSIRSRNMDDLICDRIKQELANYVTSLELERDNHRRLDALIDQPKSLSTPVSQARHKIVGPSRSFSSARPVAILDADSGRIMKIYATLNSAWNVVNFIHNLKRHECERQFSDIDSVVKLRNVVLNCQKNPNMRLYGYRWLFLNDLKEGKVKFAAKASKIVEQTVDTLSNVDKVDPINDPVELVSDGKSFLFHSVAEAMSFPGLSGSSADLTNRLQSLVPGTDFEVIDDHMWKRYDLDDFKAYGIEYVKEDTLLGGETFLCGFVHILAAYDDWCKSLDSSISINDEIRTLDVFSRKYLDQDLTVDGIRWRRVAFRNTEGSNEVTATSAQQSSSAIQTTGGHSGTQHELASTTTHSTGSSRSSASKVYDLETVPSPNSKMKRTAITASTIASNGTFSVGLNEQQSDVGLLKMDDESELRKESKVSL